MKNKILLITALLLIMLTIYSVSVTANTDPVSNDAFTTTDSENDPCVTDVFGSIVSTTTKNNTTTSTTATTTAFVVGNVTKLTIKQTGIKVVKLNWLSAKNASEYMIYKTDGSKLISCCSTVKTNYFVDSKVSRGKTYTYQIKPVGYNAYGKKVFGDYSSAKKINIFSSNLSNLKSIKRAKNYIKIKGYVYGATGYETVYSKSAKFKNKKTITSSKGTVKIKSLKAKTRYYIKMRAWKKIGSKKVYTSYKIIKVKTTK